MSWNLIELLNLFLILSLSLTPPNPYTLTQAQKNENDFVFFKCLLVTHLNKYFIFVDLTIFS